MKQYKELDLQAKTNVELLAIGKAIYDDGLAFKDNYERGGYIAANVKIYQTKDNDDLLEICNKLVAKKDWDWWPVKKKKLLLWTVENNINVTHAYDQWLEHEANGLLERMGGCANSSSQFYQNELFPRALAYAVNKGIVNRPWDPGQNQPMKEGWTIVNVPAKRAYTNGDYGILQRQRKAHPELYKAEREAEGYLLAYSYDGVAILPHEISFHDYDQRVKSTRYPSLDELTTWADIKAMITDWANRDVTELDYYDQLGNGERSGFFGRSNGWFGIDKISTLNGLLNDLENSLSNLEEEINSEGKVNYDHSGVYFAILSIQKYIEAAKWMIYGIDEYKAAMDFNDYLENLIEEEVAMNLELMWQQQCEKELRKEKLKAVKAMAEELGYVVAKTL